MFGAWGFFEFVPVGFAFLAAFHPVGGAAQGEHRLLSGLFGEFHPGVEGFPVVLAGFGFGVAGAEAHEVVVLPDRAVVLDDLDPALAGLLWSVVVEALLGVSDAELEGGRLWRPGPVALELDGGQLPARPGRGRGDRVGRAGGQRCGEHRQHGDGGTGNAHRYLGVRFGKVLP